MAKKRRAPEYVTDERVQEQLQKRKLNAINAEVTKRQISDDIPDMAITKNTLDELDGTFHDIKNTAVGKQEAEVFSRLSKITMRGILKYSKEARQHDFASFLAHFLRKYGTADENDEVIRWREIGMDHADLFNGIPSGFFLFGCMDIAPKVHKQPQRRKKPNDELVKPNVVVQEKETDASGNVKKKKEHHEMMQSQIHEVIAKSKAAVPFLELVTNPKSFTQTVENIFEYSFQVKGSEDQAFSRMYLDEDKVPMITPIVGRVEQAPKDKSSSESSRPKSASEEAAARKDVGEGFQAVLSFNMQDWASACELMKDARPFIPHRTDTIYEDR